MIIDTILFDLDGTLVQHGHVLLPAQLSEWGYPRPAEAVEAAFATQIHWFYEYASKISGTDLDTEETWRQVWPRMYRRVVEELKIDDDAIVESMVRYFATEPTPPLFEDALPLLETLADGPWQLGIITQRPRSGAIQFLSEHGLLDRFEVIIAGDDGHGRKPDPAPFQRALHVMGRTAEQAIFVGDRIDDDCGGACSAGLRAFLIDRQQFHTETDTGAVDYSFIRLTSLLELLDHLPPCNTLGKSRWPLLK